MAFLRAPAFDSFPAGTGTSRTRWAESRSADVEIAEKERSVLDHLVPTDRNLLVRYGREPMPVVLYFAEERGAGACTRRVRSPISDDGAPRARCLRILDAPGRIRPHPEEDRERLYDRTSWWDFIEADQRSEAFRALIVATTRTLLAAKAEEASAYTIALLAVRTLFDSPLRSDCVLDGPTSEVWIKPWLLYLQGRGVQLKSGYELDSIHFDGKSPRIGSLSFVRSESAVCRRQLREAGRSHERTSAARLRLMREIRSEWNECFRSDLRGIPGVHPFHCGRRTQVVCPRRRAPYSRRGFLCVRAASRANGVLREPLGDDDVVRAVAPPHRPAQYHARLDGRGPVLFQVPFGHRARAYRVRGLRMGAHGHRADAVLARRSAAAGRSGDSLRRYQRLGQKGRFIRKEAFNCTRHENRDGGVEQIKASFNRSNEPEVLRDEMLIKGTVAGSFSLDDDIVNRYDRKKHAAYARGVDQAIQHAAAVAEGAQALLESAAEHPEAPFVFGDRLEFNAEPLLVNRPGFLQLRPAARTPIENMFLAADYVRTATNLACMEGANEAARHATNAILDTSALGIRGARRGRCKMAKHSPAWLPS